MGDIRPCREGLWLCGAAKGAHLLSRDTSSSLLLIVIIIIIVILRQGRIGSNLELFLHRPCLCSLHGKCRPSVHLRHYVATDPF